MRMRYLPDGNWMKRADAHTIQDIGIPSVVLMERAALKVTEFLEQKKINTEKALVVCGSGNNGGDGFAVARLLWEKGKEVTVLFAGKESSMTEECALQAKVAGNLGMTIVTELLREEYTVIIDAIFGVGLSREVRGNYAVLIQQMNQMTGTKIAIDIPSGICSRTGKVLGCAFRADMTVTFQCEKLGMTWFPGAEYSGKITVAEIGIDTGIFCCQSIPQGLPLAAPAGDNQEISYTLDSRDLPGMLPVRTRNSHKGTYGKLLMITGSEGMAGAAFLSAKAAYTAGAGLVRIYTDESNRNILQQLIPEAVVSTYTGYDEQKLKELLEWADVVCIGCGLGKSEVSSKLLERTLKWADVPCIIDADGINLLSGKPELLKERAAPTILTPHMKEMSGLIRCSVAELAEKRFEKLRQFTVKYPSVCVLKDARTIVAENNRQYFVNTAGNQAMAKAGAGDVLAGLIAGFAAQKMESYDSAVLGVLLHALAGDEAKRQMGSYSVMAEDLIRCAGICLKNAEEKRR